MIGVNFFYDVSKQPAVQVPTFRPYAHYPISETALPGVHCWWEGCCYLPAAERSQQLEKLASAAAAADWHSCLQPISVLQQAGGEFAAWMITSSYLLFFNDWLGRLPVYHYQHAHGFFIGRSLQALFSRHTRQPDRLGLAQYVWAGYSIGQRTIFQQVQPVAPGACMVWHLPSGRLVFQQSMQLAIAQGSAKPIAEHARQLHELFVAACQKMTATGASHWHLSLSGGQDSKAVLAGMQQAGAPLRSSSFHTPEAQKDVAMAGALAARAAVEWQAFDIAADCHDAEWLIQLKQGLNYTGMGFIKCYLQQVAALQPGATLLTGDGGDVILPYFGEARKPASKDALVRLLLRRHAIATPASAAAVAGISTDELAQSIYELLATYPEPGLNDQSAHFAFFERIGKAYFEGEDRNRFFLWCTTPFYDPALVKVAMEIPQSLKRNYRLYYQWLRLLCPEWAALPDAGGGRPGGWYFHGRKWVREHFRSTPPVVKSGLRQLNQWLQPGSNAHVRRELPVPPGLEATCNAAAWQALAQKGSHESCLYLETLSKVFSR